MRLVDSIKKFITPFLDNPIKTGVVVFLIWQILKKHTSKESFSENVKVLSKKNGKQLVYDDKRKVWAVVDGLTIKYFKTEQNARKNFEGVKRVSSMNEKLDNLYKFFKEGVEDFPMSGFENGLKIEIGEHPSMNPLEAGQLVLDHLKEDINYYEVKNE